MTNYLKDVYGTPTPQSEPLPEREAEMAKNNADGFVFTVDSWTQFQRFLVLGSEGGSYYVDERKLTLENAKNVRACIKEDGIRAVTEIVNMSEAGRIAKNDTALFALAMSISFGDEPTKKLAVMAVPMVVRTGTHLFEFIDYADSMRGWGRSLKRAVAKWYNSKTPRNLIYQALKYQQRQGWSHRDALRKAHPKGQPELYPVFDYITKGNVPATEDTLIHAFEKAKTVEPSELPQLIRECGLTREMVPSEGLKEPKVMAALMDDMPMTALVRNLGNLTRLGVIKALSNEANEVSGRLVDVNQIKRARIHPITALSARLTYGRGTGFRGSNTWEPLSEINAALDKMVSLSFDQVEPTGKRFYIGVDVSPSMSTNSLANCPGLTAASAAGVLALVTAKTEPRHYIRGFMSTPETIVVSRGLYRTLAGRSDMLDLGITAQDSFDDAHTKVTNLQGWGGTDCALPMLDAMSQNLEVDCFMVLTDNETWAGSVHPSEALKQYRKKSGINAKLIVVAMTPTKFSIADPSDAGMLDVVGFDTSVPRLISDFVTA